jgi:hypothetical protein
VKVETFKLHDVFGSYSFWSVCGAATMEGLFSV